MWAEALSLAGGKAAARRMRALPFTDLNHCNGNRTEIDSPQHGVQVEGVQACRQRACCRRRAGQPIAPAPLHVQLAAEAQAAGHGDGDAAGAGSHVAGPTMFLL